jgi:hypothetical protein
MRSRGALLALSTVAAAACGPPPVSYQLTIAQAYDAVGVLRVFPDGVMPASLEEAYFVLDGLAVSNGKVVGHFTPKGRSSSVPLSGTFESSTGRLNFDPVSASLTTTSAESIEQLGGRADDKLPKDGLADEISGFIQARRGVEIANGTWLGTERQDHRPPPVSIEKVTLTAEDSSRVRVTGQPGATLGSVGVEIFRFQVAVHDPTLTVGQAEKDGSFSVPVDGVAEDAFILRALAAGIAGDGRVFRPGK